jgi:3-keto-disaccharide hydrolase
MKVQRNTFVFLITLLELSAAAYSRNADTGKSFSQNPSDSVKLFLGRWDLTLKAPDREYPSWLELSQENRELKARMVGRWGSARRLPKVEIASGHLKFVSPKEEEGRNDDMVFEATLSGTRLSGTTTGPDGTPWTWSGERAPSLKRSGNPKWGRPISLFNGKNLSGWTISSNSSSVWKIENGDLITPGEGPELISDAKFQDFKLHVDFNCGPSSNSGVYLRGRYEVQIETDSIAEPPSDRTGSVYGFLAPSSELPRKPGEWQTFDITLIGRTISVVQNGQTIINNQEIPGITGGALDSHEALPGPIYLQGSEKGRVAFRNIAITPAER